MSSVHSFASALPTKRPRSTTVLVLWTHSLSLVSELTPCRSLLASSPHRSVLDLLAPLALLTPLLAPLALLTPLGPLAPLAPLTPPAMTIGSIPKTMKAVVLEAPYKVAVKEVPSPEIQKDNDVILKTKLAGLCGEFSGVSAASAAGVVGAAGVDWLSAAGVALVLTAGSIRSWARRPRRPSSAKSTNAHADTRLRPAHLPRAPAQLRRDRDRARDPRHRRAGRPGREELQGWRGSTSGIALTKPQDVVLSPFSTSCGKCMYCEMGYTARCEGGGQLLGTAATPGECV